LLPDARVVRRTASLRTWLYQIATRRCLDARRAAARSPAKAWDVPHTEPPEPTRLGEVVWLEPGRAAVGRFSAALFDAGRLFNLVPTRADGQPPFGAYLRASTGLRHGVGLYVLALDGERISALTRFENSVLPRFGLPRSLYSRTHHQVEDARGNAGSAYRTSDRSSAVSRTVVGRSRTAARTASATSTGGTSASSPTTR
jgi:hypothetical protein